MIFSVLFSVLIIYFHHMCNYFGLSRHTVHLKSVFSEICIIKIKLIPTEKLKIGSKQWPWRMTYFRPQFHPFVIRLIFHLLIYLYFLY